MNYSFKGLSLEETKNYIKSRFKLAGVHEPIFTEDALELIHSSSNGLARRINSLVNMTLLSAAKEKLKTIDSEFIFKAHNEIEIVFTLRYLFILEGIRLRWEAT